MAEAHLSRDQVTGTGRDGRIEWPRQSNCQHPDDG